MRLLLWDIETTNLNANFGVCLCIGYKWYGQSKVHVESLLNHSDDFAEDGDLIKWFVDNVFNQADVHATWYGARFDLPYINTKLLMNDNPPPKEIPHLDLWWTARKQFKFHSNRLQVIQESLQLPDEKTPISYKDWIRAAQGRKSAMKEVVRHCRQDVLVLEEAYEKFRPWVRQPHPQHLIDGRPDACPRCGSEHITRQGYKHNKTMTYAQFQCQGCGGWLRARVAEKLDRPTYTT